MNYFITSINIILLLFIIYTIYKWNFLKEGLEGCPADSSDLESDRKRGAKREEINSTIADLKAEINRLNIDFSMFKPNVLNNTKELEKISDAAAKKAKENKSKLDNLK